jgi:hypothetical protein
MGVVGGGRFGTEAGRSGDTDGLGFGALLLQGVT